MKKQDHDHAGDDCGPALQAQIFPESWPIFLESNNMKLNSASIIRAANLVLIIMKIRMATFDKKYLRRIKEN